MRREIALCKAYWQCYPLHYFRYNLYRADAHLTDQALLDYIPEFYFYTLFLAHYDNDKYAVLLSDKNLTEQLFRSVGIRQARTVCKVMGGRLFDPSFREITFSDVQRELCDYGCSKIFVKPVDGAGGYGIHIFGRSPDGSFRRRDGATWGEPFLRDIGEKRNYIVQCGLIQLPEMSAMYAHSVNTFRLATENKSQRVRVLCSTLRMGRGGNEVDNSAQDGVIAGIEIDTGRLLPTASDERGNVFPAHPDTGFPFEAGRITAWPEVTAFAVDAASRLPQFTYLGWDIALTKDGPVAIETNLGFGLDHYQVILGGLRGTFGIDDPDYYWKHRGKRL